MNLPDREGLKIVLLSVAAAVVYGVTHDQVTARICIEYFTVGHPPVFATENPTLLAFGFGILATWWFGLFLGVPLAVIARFGPPPKVSARQLLTPIAILLLAVGSVAFVAGIVGYFAAAVPLAIFVEPALRALPEEKQAPYLADSCAHAAGYLMGFIGATGVWLWAWRQRD